MRPNPGTTDSLVEARRRFLASCGKFAVATPPVVTLMLAESERNYAVAGSGGRKGGGSLNRGNNGYGNGGGDGVPGRSGGNPSPNAGEKRDDKVR